MITTKMANFIYQTSYDDIPPEVISKAKLCFLDFIGVSLLGSRSRSGEILKSIINSDGPSTIIGGSKTSPLEASLVNGVSAHAMDLDDGHRLALLHPGAPVIPAALSLSEAKNIMGKEFLTALVVGYQVALFMGLLVNPQHRMKGFHSTGTCGAFGAAAAASKVLKLNENEVVNSLGLAGAQASGLLESDHSGSMGKHLHAGKASQTGVLSAILSRKGFSGASSIIEGKEGFLQATSELDHSRISGLIKGLFRSYHIQGVYFKEYPVCRHLHSAIDGAISLREKYEIKSHEIFKIDVETYRIAAEHDNYHPKTAEAKRQSLPVCIAQAISDGELVHDNFDTDEEVMNLALKVFIKPNKRFESLYPEKRAAKITIHTQKESFEETVHLSKGEPEKPFNWEDLQEKFLNLNPEYNKENLKCIKKIESYDMQDIMRILNPSLRSR